jgi:hypothetical protein
MPRLAVASPLDKGLKGFPGLPSTSPNYHARRSGRWQVQLVLLSLRKRRYSERERKSDEEWRARSTRRQSEPKC